MQNKILGVVVFVNISIFNTFSRARALPTCKRKFKIQGTATFVAVQHKLAKRTV